ncbi:hypothetical protein [Hymenobacter sp. CRA2]|uniref:hypothetical protein n=1 Tax=Hymenobacter sp. CRA2 TaxID=1955620 RepID=UPI00098F6D20|nr:hypothetical protein [Hymenobacter sp. CRA2]OON69115.1 hypothetical protein B0919_10420 [Hymenobacter sp. CRA2]
MSKEQGVLDELAAQEMALYAQISAAQTEPSRPAFDAIYTRVTAEYTQVYQQYVGLLRATTDPAVWLEVLKRTVFLRWYIFTEPDWLSGIGMPRPDDAATVFDALDAAIARQQLDAEFDWMLAHYANWVWEEALQPLGEEGGPRPAMTRFLREKTALSQYSGPGYEAIPAYVDPNTITGRGQLSHYWRHMINRQPLT